MRQAWMFFVGNLTYFVGVAVTALLILATVKITTRDMRKTWKRELDEFGPEIVKNEIGKRQRLIHAQAQELVELRQQKAEWTENRRNLRRVLTEALEWLKY